MRARNENPSGCYNGESQCEQIHLVGDLRKELVQAHQDEKESIASLSQECLCVSPSGEPNKFYCQWKSPVEIICRMCHRSSLPDRKHGL